MISSPSTASIPRSKSLSAVWKIIEPAAVSRRESARPGVALGTVHGFGSSFSNERAIQILKRGISSRVIDPLADYLDVGKGDLAGILDLDRTTALRRAGKDQPLPKHSAENVLRLLELKDMASDTFESEDDAIGWLRRPHPLLDGESPLESAANSFGARRVKDILVAIKYGGVV